MARPRIASGAPHGIGGPMTADARATRSRAARGIGSLGNTAGIPRRAGEELPRRDPGGFWRSTPRIPRAPYGDIFPFRLRAAPSAGTPPLGSRPSTREIGDRFQTSRAEVSEVTDSPIGA